MNNPITKSVWLDSLNLQQQPDPWLGIPGFIERFFRERFGSPRFPFWIRDEIIQFLKHNSHLYQNFKLISVQLYLPSSLRSEIDQYIDTDREDKFNLLGEWLTEQVAAETLRLQGNWPGIFCMVNDNEEKPDLDKDYVPAQKTLNRLRSFSEKYTKDNRIIDLVPAFWLRFQPYTLSGPASQYLQILTPTGLWKKKIVPHFDKVKKIGLHYLRQMDPLSERLLPLVAAEHIDLIATRVNADERIWLRHRGDHETWVIGRKDDRESGLGWYLGTRSAWVPLLPRNAVILGRVVRDRNEDMRVVNGSLVLRVCGKEDDGVND